ncbi:MAG TPA: metal-dependent hydrolase [Tissierellales bacterium]|nr:metal-dependent hydrolase [Tissierellales bacterium]
MTGKTHIAIGIAAGLTVSSGQPIENQLALILASAIGSLVPDLDHPKAKLNQKFLLIKNNTYRTFFYLFLSGLFLYLYFVVNNKTFGLLGIVTFFIGISEHRGFTHSIVGFLISISIVKIVTSKYGFPPIYTGFTLGYALHLAADFFNPKGIKLFYPLKNNISSPITVKTYSSAEKLIFIFLNVYSILLLFKFLNS